MSIHPLPYETLVALWAGELSGDELDAVEAHLFACDPCAAQSERLGAVIVAMRSMIPPVLSRMQRDQLAASGVRIRELAIEQPSGNEAIFDRDIDLLVFALRGDLRDAERVDVEVLGTQGARVTQFLHVPFDPDRGEVLIACQRHYESFQAVTSDTPAFRVIAHHAGTTREVGTYAIKHIFR